MQTAFDYLVIGAGAAGCVIAERLSRSGRTSVGVVEAGGKPSGPFVRMPAGFSRLFKSDVDWNYQSTPQTPGGRAIYAPRGKMLGGSANMNAQIHQWGHPDDFDGWAASGAAGWAFDDVAPIFRAMERLADAAGDDRGRDGTMAVEANRHAHPLSHAFVAAAHNTGLPCTPHYNGERFEGAWIAEIAHRQGRRFSVYDAYLKPAMMRRNVTVLPNAQVRRIVFSERRATGAVIFGPDGDIALQARRGVILSAGAFGSPQILMCSGVGPAAMLRACGIPMVLDAPGVGANLHDHPMSALTFAARRRDTLKHAQSPANILRYLIGRRGPLASNAIEAIAFASSKGPGAGVADIEIMFAPLEWRDQGLSPPRVDAVSFAPAALAPKSRGRVSIATADTRDPPIIDFNLLGDPAGDDRRALLAGVRLAKKIAAAEPLAGAIAARLDAGAGIADEREELDALIESTLQTVYHPAGSCRMGADNSAVVGPDLKAVGLYGLWIADASIMPTVVRGHPNAATAMIGARAAERVLEA